MRYAEEERRQARRVAVALTTNTYVEQLGKTLAEAASHEPLVEELWVSTLPGGVRLWLVTKDIDMDAEHDLHALSDVLYERFDTSDFEVFIINPRHSTGDAHRALPQHAVQIPLRAS